MSPARWTLRAATPLAVAFALLLPAAAPVAATVTVGPEGPQDETRWMDVTWNFPAEWGVREPFPIVFQDQLYVFFEGRMTSNPEGVGYLGSLFYRTFTERTNATTGVITPRWGPVRDLTALPPPRYIDHANQKITGAVFRDRLIVVWQSVDSNRTGTNDSRILSMQSDGTNWTDPVVVSQDALSTGLDSEPQVAVFQGRLWLIWSRQPSVDASTRDIAVRSYDGTAWSDIQILSTYPNPGFAGEWPALGSYGGSLYAAWQEEVPLSGVRHVLAVYDPTDDRWGGPQVIGTSPPSTTTLISQPAFATYIDRATGKEELGLVYVTRGEGTAHASRADTDIILRTFDGTVWRSFEVSPREDAGDDQTPAVIRHGDLLLISWSSRDPGTAPGNDYDIVARTFDGVALGPLRLLSPTDDRDQPVAIDAEPWNLGTDDWPRLVSYHGRTFAAWKTVDNSTTVRDNGGVGEPWSILLVLVEDGDRDGDHVGDFADACPDDPADWTDTDHDGICDHRDPTPTGKEKVPRWEEGEAPPPASIGWFVASVLAFALVMTLLWTGLTAPRGGGGG